MTKPDYDIAIIGGGPGGMTAALYAARANLNVALIEAELPGGQMNNTDRIDNYPGNPGVTGAELSEIMESQLVDYENVTWLYERVIDVQLDGDVKTITFVDREPITARAVIIATGTKHRKLGVPGEDMSGVSYCAVCDGIFFEGKTVAVVGGGDSAIEEAIYLTNYASDVVVIHRRDELRAQPVLQQAAFDNDKISFVWNSTVESINGDDQVVSLTLKSTLDGGTSELPVGGVFVYVGMDPNTGFLPETILEDGFVKTFGINTIIPGVFAIGDVRKDALRQIATAVGDGALAGQTVYGYLNAH